MDEWEATEHLARQLSIDASEVFGDLHVTLRFIIDQVDPIMGDWPLPQTPDDCRPIARAAVRSLNPMETYSMLRAGPGRWRTGHTGDVTVEALPSRLRSLLETAVATGLSELFTRWVEEDIRDLEKRYRAAKQAKKDEEERERAEVVERSRATKAGKRRSPEEIRKAREQDRIGPPFTPPPNPGRR